MRQALFAAAAPLRDTVPGATWTPAERLHLTVRFLGDTPGSRVPPLADALRQVAASHGDVPLRIAGAGAFPSVRRPRVIWAGVEPAPRLELLQHDVEAALDTLGVPLEGRAFRPHITFGRIKAPLDAAAIRALARAARAFSFAHDGDVSSLDLMQSTLTRQGSRYRCLASAPIRAG